MRPFDLRGASWGARWGRVPAVKPASLPAPGAPNVLYLVDLSGYVFRAYHAIAPLSSSRGEPTHAVLGTVNMIQKVVNERRPSLLAVAMDSKGPSFRKELDPRYKATRPAPPPDLSGQMARCEEIVRAYRIPVFQEVGVEADDLIATVAARAVADGLRVVIVSADKDMMQILHDDDDAIVMWDSMRDRVYGPAEVEAKWGVPPSQVRDLLALTGDSSDNVPGVPSVGPKTAADLLRAHGSLDGIYAALDTIKRAKLREKLTEHEADARISQKLVTLRADLSIAWEPAELAYGGADIDALRRLFIELEFTRMLDVLGGQATTTPAASKNPLKGKGKAPAAPSAIKRTYSVVTDLTRVASLLEAARAAGALGVHAVGTVADPIRADVLGVALSAGEGEGGYVPVGHRYLGVPAQPSWAALRELLAPVLADAAVRKVGYDIKATENLLTRSGAPLAGPLGDPMLAGYLLDPEAPHQLKDLARRELGVELPVYDVSASARRAGHVPFDELELEPASTYTAPLAELPLSLASRLEPRVEDEGMGALYRDVELPLSRVLGELERVGVLVDAAELGRVGLRVAQDLESLEARCMEAAGRRFALRSRDQLEEILFDELKLPVVKKTPKGGRSTDATVLEELSDRHPLPKLVLEYRELDKLKGTYLDALPRAVNPQTGRVHTRFEQAVAATGRLSSVDPNLQNIPVRTEVGRLVRSAFIAPPGHVLVSADYSQIELRVLAHLSEDAQLVRAFREDIDVHVMTASLVFDVDTTQVTADMRRQAKTINFGVIYGMGEAALARQLDIPRAEAARFIDAYFERYEGVRRFMERTVAAARSGEAVRTLLGRRRFLPNLHSANRGLRFEAERIAKNTPIQGTAADILKLAMVSLGKGDVVPGARMILTVHDELLFEVPEGSVDAAKERIREAMRDAHKLAVPVVVDVGQGKSWADAH